MEIADQVKIAFRTKVLQGTLKSSYALVRRPELFRHRKVVVQPGDGLHEAVVAIGQAGAIQALEAADVGTAIARDRHLALGTRRTRHAGSPEDLALRHVLQSKTMDVFQHLKTAIDGWVLGCDELKQRFGKVRCDVGVGQRRAERLGMRTPGNAPLTRNAQTFLFDAAANRGPLRSEFGKPIALQGNVETVSHGDSGKEESEHIEKDAALWQKSVGGATWAITIVHSPYRVLTNLTFVLQ